MTTYKRKKNMDLWRMGRVKKCREMSRDTIRSKLSTDNGNSLAVGRWGEGAESVRYA